MLIGKIFSATDLGFFSRANQLQSFPSNTLATLVGRVTFPILSKMQHNPHMFKLGLRKTLILVAFLNFPIMIGIAAVAKPLIILILTDKWKETIPYLQLLSVAGALFPLEWIRQQAIQAVGRPDLSLRAEIFKKLALLISVAFMWYWGIIGIITGIIFASFLSLSLNIHYTALVSQYSKKEQLLDMFPYIIISITMGIILLFINEIIINYSYIYQLLIQIFAGFIFYVCATFFFRTSASIAIQQELKQFIKCYYSGN